MRANSSTGVRNYQTEVVSAWEKVVEEVSESLTQGVAPMITHLLHAYLSDRVIDVFSPDPGVGDDTKEELKLLEEIRSRAKGTSRDPK